LQHGASVMRGDDWTRIFGSNSLVFKNPRKDQTIAWEYLYPAARSLVEIETS
jgi:hypothetical protein